MMERKIISRTGHTVKAQIIGAGLTCRELAVAAGVSPQTMSDLLSGRNRSVDTQFRVWAAFRRLTGSDITLRGFWRDLLAEEAA